MSVHIQKAHLAEFPQPRKLPSPAISIRSLFSLALDPATLTHYPLDLCTNSWLSFSVCTQAQRAAGLHDSAAAALAGQGESPLQSIPIYVCPGFYPELVRHLHGK